MIILIKIDKKLYRKQESKSRSKLQGVLYQTECGFSFITETVMKII